MANAAETVGAKLSETRIRNYAALLADLDEVELQPAMMYLLQNGSGFLPNIPEIRAACGRLGAQDRAILAWAAIVRAASEAGAYLSVTFEDGAIATAIETVWGSWEQACAEIGDGPASHARRAEFLAAYKVGAASRPIEKRLAGICESIGSYPHDGRSWTVTLTDGGEVVAHRDAPSLVSGIARKQLGR